MGARAGKTEWEELLRRRDKLSRSGKNSDRLRLVPIEAKIAELQSYYDGLVRSVRGACCQQAYRYFRMSRHLSAAVYEDFESAAFSGAFWAAVKYEPERGFKFLTYAMSWIRHYCQDHMNDLYHHTCCSQVKGRSSPEDRPVIRLDDEVGDGGDWKDLVSLSDEAHDESTVEETRSSLERLRSVLSARDWSMLQMRFIEQLTLDEIGERIDCTRENVRQHLSRIFERCRRRCVELVEGEGDTMFGLRGPRWEKKRHGTPGKLHRA